MDIGNEQSIAIYFDKIGEQPSLQFKQGKTVDVQDVKIMNLDYLRSKAFMDGIPNINKVFAAILAGQWDTQERIELANNLTAKISAKNMPQLKIIKKSNFAKWSTFEINFLEWARLNNAASDLLTKLFKELEDYTYEKPMPATVTGYRWKMIKTGGGQGAISSEIFTGPWQQNLRSVVNNCKEFSRRAKNGSVQDGKDTMVIDMLDIHDKVRTLGPIIE